MTLTSITPTTVEGGEDILTDEAVAFISKLQSNFGPRRNELLAARPGRHAEIARAGRVNAAFLDSTKDIRQDLSWQVAPTPLALSDRRVEITGPTERKMTINALNSGARVWLADLEDANTPHWSNVVAGQVNLRAAILGDIDYVGADGRRYELKADIDRPTIVMRPRGWHLDERNVQVDGGPAVGALVDFGFYFFHNAANLIAHRSGPYFYLPKMESHLEARLWADVFAFSEAALGIEAGTIRATVLIETLPAAFEMEEILYELREYASGLNAGRWDYLFSLIKVFRASGAEYVLPDRNSVVMTAPFMRSYTELLVSTCHRRGAYAIGGMAAFIPSRKDEALNRTAFDKVRADKKREAGDGFDGSWVAHPDLVPVCSAEFSARFGESTNQLARLRDDVLVEAGDLLHIASAGGSFTEDGLRNNVAVGLRYLAAWLSGSGAVAISNLMEDAATAEIARAQIWQWVHNEIALDSGRRVTRDYVEEILVDELVRARQEPGWLPTLDQAADLFKTVALADDFVEFLTLPAYDLVD